ncbi:MAG: hypothetical protein COB17_04595 [Sulfurimonas sp.]|nr:MAG: hypothetical protein COB17_04595 [Sulfurimonas sp.]
MKKILVLIFVLFVSLYADKNYVVINEDTYENLILVEKGSYKILEFSKMISKVKVNDSKTLEITFIKNKDKPLHILKIYAKDTGSTTIFIDFADQSNAQVEFSIIKDLSTIIKLAKKISPELIVNQSNGEIILQGKVNTNKDKRKIIKLFEKANIDIKKDLIDLIVVKNPDKMLRVKLYVTEINNNEGLEIKNSWAAGYKNYERNYLSAQEAPSSSSAFNPILANSIEGAVTLSGGLTAGANALGSAFNAGLVLNYLSSKGVAKILDETTLITLENKEAKFHAGGTIYIKIQTTTDKGVPSTQLRSIKYGLQLIIKAKEIVNGEYIDMEIITKSTQIDRVNQVDGIPSFTDKTIETSVLAKNKATLVLGGLIKSQDIKTNSQIPLLGDLPLIGALFRSKDFQEGRSELVFFITPEIVDVSKNNEKKVLDKSTKLIQKDIKFKK